MLALIVIPARGGSKGIPRKNLRQLNGRPLIYYSIRTALSVSFQADVIITSEDEEILQTAKQFGAHIRQRPSELSNDETPLSPVIYDAFVFATSEFKKDYDIVITMQPTSPLLKPATLMGAYNLLSGDDKFDSVISVKKETHLSWRKDGNEYTPIYEERLNRQYLDPIFVETGSFFITRSKHLNKSSHFGGNVTLYELPKDEGIDIDTFEDWSLCEYYLKRKKLLFVVKGNKKVGLGHAYRCLTLANDILDHEIEFITDAESTLAFDLISANNYIVIKQKSADILDDIKSINPDIVINDCLDTSIEYIQGLKQSGLAVINFEDLGEGAKYADIVFNAMYPEDDILPQHYFGEKYFCLRDEFINTSFQPSIKKKISNILISFGGVDPLNLTSLVYQALIEYCKSNNITINIVLGMGYNHTFNNTEPSITQVHKNVKSMSAIMSDADIAFTSGGRTTFELSSLGIPTVVICQNERETTHFFAYSKFGFINLGLGTGVGKNQILITFRDLAENYVKRQFMSRTLLDNDIKNGRKRIINILKSFIESI